MDLLEAVGLDSESPRMETFRIGKNVSKILHNPWKPAKINSECESEGTLPLPALFIQSGKSLAAVADICILQLMVLVADAPTAAMSASHRGVPFEKVRIALPRFRHDGVDFLRTRTKAKRAR